MRKRAERTIHENAAVIEYFFKLVGRFMSSLQKQIRLCAQINGIQRSTCLQERRRFA